MACLIANKIGVVTVNDIAEPELLKRWSVIGIDQSRITSIKFIDISFQETVRRKEEVWNKFIELGKEQVEKEGAETVIPSCLTWIPTFELFIAPDAKEQLEGILGVPVMNPSAVMVKFAEMMANLKLAQSKKAYPYNPPTV
jgi:Asp/Glu/hydantoin racemase